MEYKVFKAKTVNDAITDALIEFGVTSDMLDYEVVEEGSAGLLGLFSKDAVIKAKRKEESVKEEDAIDFSIKDEINAGRVDLKSPAPSKKPARPEKKKSVKNADQEPAPALKKDDKPFEIKPDEVPASTEKLKVSISRPGDKPKEKPDVPAKEHTVITGKEAQNEEVNEILKLFFEKLDVKCSIETSIDMDDKIVNINITGDNTVDIIGKKGQTLDAIQYLISIIVNKKKGDYFRVKVDTNNYRERRQKTLENQARNVASKVKKTRRKVVMEPMNPYERRIIHSYLQSDKSVTTKSEGEEPNRKVVVYYKKS